MDNFVDYYELLHVQPTAPAVVIKASYRTMMQKLNHHPDRGGDVAFAQLLNSAAETLCNPDTRARYDSLRQQIMGASPQQHTDSVNQNKSAGSTWGEPGGSPNTAGYTSLPATPHCLFCRTPCAATSLTANTAYAYASRCSGCNGACTPIEQLPGSSNEELRRMHRQQHNSYAQLWTEWPATAALQVKITDFSPNGCALSHSLPLDNGHVVMIETPLFNAICTVRHCHRTDHSGYLIGLAFVTLHMQAAPGSVLDATA